MVKKISAPKSLYFYTADKFSKLSRFPRIYITNLKIIDSVVVELCQWRMCIVKFQHSSRYLV